MSSLPAPQGSSRVTFHHVTSHGTAGRLISGGVDTVLRVMDTRCLSAAPVVIRAHVRPVFSCRSDAGRIVSSDAGGIVVSHSFAESPLTPAAGGTHSLDETPSSTQLDVDIALWTHEM
eukprot:CAMPEP_0175944504 /NCGR_PEP_ID=MMETSP0108-20121206/26156_1 /TAXON_ID=195067 ORGANISM="Goniomonas pacifica, Strain CCMP1869" /NCGR_SAMPLE_ID=MMETSP0108 /ASSEMBLY_ACC=CAM_ASM_000204 /LENGTH=117 /DNA_ID=CAMNT_0017269609 /DNA_START=21 /DNA_END=375 /DNA_ORIENTATION=+